MGRLGYFILGALAGMAGTVATAYIVSRDSDSTEGYSLGAGLEPDELEEIVEMEFENGQDFLGDEEPTMA